MLICDPLRENQPLSICYETAVKAWKVIRIKNGVRDLFFILFKIIIFIPLAIYGWDHPQEKKPKTATAKKKIQEEDGREPHQLTH